MGLWTLVLLICVLGVRANPIDSLQGLLQSTSTNDRHRVRLLNELAQQSLQTDSALAFHSVRNALALSQQLADTTGQATAHYLRGKLLSYYESDRLALDAYLKAIALAQAQGDSASVASYLLACGTSHSGVGQIEAAIRCYERALHIAQARNDQAMQIRCLGNLSVVYTGLGQYQQALDGYKRALDILDGSDDRRMRGQVYNNMGEISKYQGNYPEALELYHKSLLLKEHDADTAGQTTTLVNMAGIYTLQGDTLRALRSLNRALALAQNHSNKRLLMLCYEGFGKLYLQQNKSEALASFEQALDLAEGLANQSAKLNLTVQIGDFHRLQSNRTQALSLYFKALDMAEALKRKRVICETKLKVGQIYFEQNQLEQAHAYSSEGLQWADSLNLLSAQKDAHKQLSGVYAAQQHFREAYEHQVLYKQLDDRIFSEKNIQKIAELNFAFQFEKEKQVLELEQVRRNAVQRALVIGLLSGLSLLLLFLAYVLRSNRMKQQANTVLTRQKSEIETLNSELVRANDALVVAQEKELKRVNDELEANQKSMTAATLKLIQNAERDARAIDQLLEIEKGCDPDTKQKIKALIADHKRVSSHSNWNEFEILFEKVHRSFYEKLNAVYPDLTPNERRICAFLKLNMSNKDIAQITFQSEDALKKARLRLRQKLAIDRETNLSAFLQSI